MVVPATGSDLKVFLFCSFDHIYGTQTGLLPHVDGDGFGGPRALGPGLECLSIDLQVDIAFFLQTCAQDQCFNILALRHNISVEVTGTAVGCDECVCICLTTFSFVVLVPIASILVLIDLSRAVLAELLARDRKRVGIAALVDLMRLRVIEPNGRDISAVAVER